MTDDVLGLVFSPKNLKGAGFCSYRPTALKVSHPHAVPEGGVARYVFWA